jgi:hypothetical protein
VRQAPRLDQRPGVGSGFYVSRIHGYRFSHRTSAGILTSLWETTITNKNNFR